MAELINDLAGWVKGAIVLAGVLGTNVLSNGMQYNQRTAPAEAVAASRDAYGQQMEVRYIACLDRNEEVIESRAELAQSHEARLQRCMMSLEDTNRQLRDCRAGR